MRRAFRAAVAVAAVALLLGAGLFLRGPAPSSTPGGSAVAASPASPGPTGGGTRAGYLLPDPAPAPPIDLVAADGSAFSLRDAPGEMTLVFFGYTHCPDVCPATTGVLGGAMRAFGPGVRALFVTVDPERDTGPWLRDYARFLPEGFTALTGDPSRIAATAEAWGVRYARVDGERPEDYTMAHTADVFLVGAEGNLRARFPFGTEKASIVETLRLVAASTPAASAPAPASTPTTAPGGTPALGLRPLVVSSSVWAQPGSPVIFTIAGPAGRMNDAAADVRVQLATADGAPTGAAVPARSVQPPGTGETFYVAAVDIPAPGAWRFDVTAQPGAVPLRGLSNLVTVVDGGDTPRIGDAAPGASTPSLAEVDGDLRRLTTDPVPDRRLTARTTGDALAAGDPFALVLDSYRFKATPACGRALNLAKQLVDRWSRVAFIHHEPFRYSIVTDTPVLEGSLTDPVLSDPARAWGLDGAPWDAASMPWVFIVDGAGTVRAKYQGVVGTDDLDVILAQLDAED